MTTLPEKHITRFKTVLNYACRRLEEGDISFEEFKSEMEKEYIKDLRLFEFTDKTGFFDSPPEPVARHKSTPLYAACVFLILGMLFFREPAATLLMSMVALLSVILHMGGE